VQRLSPTGAIIFPAMDGQAATRLPFGAAPNGRPVDPRVDARELVLMG
jgi:hypothetical protein